MKQEEEQSARLSKVVNIRFIEKVKFEQTFERSERVS